MNKWDFQSLIDHYFQQQNLYAAKPLPAPPLDLTPIADAIREGFQSIANAIEYLAQIKGVPNTSELAAALLKEVDAIDRASK